MNKHLQDCLDQLTHNATMQVEQADKIIQTTSDYAAKHYATDIKAKAEDNLRMVGAMQALIKGRVKA